MSDTVKMAKEFIKTFEAQRKLLVAAQDVNDDTYVLTWPHDGFGCVLFKDGENPQCINVLDATRLTGADLVRREATKAPAVYNGMKRYATAMTRQGVISAAIRGVDESLDTVREILKEEENA
jgi:hypothetical protein